MLAPAGEQHRRQPVDQHPRQGHADHQPGRGGGGGGEAVYGLPGDEAAGEHQDHRIGQGGQHRSLSETIGAPRSRRSPRQPRRATRHGKGEDVRKVVPGVRQ